MICPHCKYVFIPTVPPPGVYWQKYCPRCRCLYLERDPNWHNLAAAKDSIIRLSIYKDD